MIKIGLCFKCRKFFAPTLMFPLSDEDQECIFCNTGKDTILYKKDGEGVTKNYTRQEAAEDYQKFLRMLKDKPAVSKIVAEEGAKILKET